jgi:hypothetical protein
MEFYLHISHRSSLRLYLHIHISHYEMKEGPKEFLKQDKHVLF